MADSKPICSIDGCDNQIIARKMCGKHYQRWRKTATCVKPRARPGEPLQWIDDHAGFDGDECLTWPFAKYGSGYGMVNLPDGRAAHASRVLCERANGPAPTKEHHAAHRCGKGHEACVNPKHLYWATKVRNERDKIIHGTSNRGSRNAHAKIGEKEALAIRASGDHVDVIASRFGISRWTVWDIKSGRSWAWLK